MSDKKEMQVIEERDTAYKMLDKFVETMESVFDQDFGEHSNFYNPWENALAFLEGLDK